MQAPSLGCMDSLVVARRLSSCDLGPGTHGLQWLQHTGSLAMAHRLQSTRLSSCGAGLVLPQHVES